MSFKYIKLLSLVDKREQKWSEPTPEFSTTPKMGCVQEEKELDWSTVKILLRWGSMLTTISLNLWPKYFYSPCSMFPYYVTPTYWNISYYANDFCFVSVLFLFY